MSIEQKAAEYRALLSATRAQIKIELLASLEAEVLNRTQKEREELSRLLHEAHAAGTPISRLRVVTGAYANARLWDPLWAAYQPATPTDLRRRSRPEGVPVVDALTIEDGFVSYTKDGETLTAQWDGSNLIPTGWDANDYPDEFVTMLKAVLASEGQEVF